MTTIPDFRAQGLITSDLDLGAAMSRSRRRGRRLPRLHFSVIDLPSHSAAPAQSPGT
jgi:hypothetical protein